MRKILIAVALLALAPAAFADVYKWLDRNGIVHYSDTPPVDARSRSVDLRFAGSAMTIDVNSCCVAKEDTPKPAEQPVYIVVAAEPATPNPAPRGLDFGVYIMLRRGMSEGELLQRAGPPDFESTDGNSVQTFAQSRRGRPIHHLHGRHGRGLVIPYGFSNLIVKTFYYYPTLSNPFTTELTLVGGRIADLQRTRQF